MKNIYYSLYSHILYAIEVWGSAFKTELDKILILQKRAIRFMTYNDAYLITPGPLRPSDPIFSELNFLKVEDIFKFQVSKFVFKCLYGNTPLQFRAAFGGSLLNKIALSFMYMYVSGLTVCDFVICIYGSR